MSLVQQTDIIEMDGRSYGLIESPLAKNELLFQTVQKMITVRMSNNWKGYTGYWMIQDGGLYLQCIEIATPSIRKPGRVQSLIEFKEALSLSKPMPALWFSGILYLQDNKPWEISIIGRGKDFDMTIHIGSGVVQSISRHIRVTPKRRKLKRYIDE